MIVARKWFDRSFGLIWLLIGLACLFAAGQQLNSDINDFHRFDPSVLVPTTAAVLAALACTAFLRAWPLSTVLNRILGVIVLLYSLAVLTIGNEDVGGPVIAVPFGLAGIAFGIWSMIIKRRRA
ncbi:MAG: hypothetical protein WCS01_16805 [bacterium]